jgi:murein L,D-transpeptidase YcbB/YkuD
VDWRKVDPEHVPYRFRQDPGGKNPLGRLKFDLTNDLHIYLHDTPSGGVFGRTDRDVSHGCIRVQNALELADRIASDAARDKIHEALDQPEERRIDLDSKIPVHILYWTAWADEAGNLHFAPDIYGFDLPQRAALDRAAGKA